MTRSVPAVKLRAISFLITILIPMVAYSLPVDHCGTINSETWGPGTHYVSCSVTVADNQVLTIQPGAVVKFAPNTYLAAYGTLRALGTGTGAADSIAFTSRDDNSAGEILADSDGVPAQGDWYGIQLYGTGDYEGTGEFDYCLFRYGGYAGAAYDANVYFNLSDSGYMAHCISEYSGQHGVRITNSSPEITDSTFRDNVLNGLYASGGGMPTVTGNTFNDNGQYAAHLNQVSISPLISGNTGSGNQINALVFEGNVTADQTWTSTPGFPIVLWSSVQVNDDVRLTIAPGTVIKFNANRYLSVYGTLDANGTEGSPVVFTSLKDDAYEGDTNGDGTDTSPAPGDWYGIQLYGTGDYEGTGEFDYCLFRYGGYAGAAYDANVYFNLSDSGYMAHCISEYSGQHGVEVYNCSPQITDSIFRDNVLSGLFASGSGTPTITGNTFTDNGQYAAHLDEVSISLLISGNTGSGNQIDALVLEGNVTADQTWTSTPGFPIVLWSSVQVNDDVRLTIAPGTVIKFNANRYLSVYGTLDANGTEGSPVVFTSLKDDTIDGDTNGDGNATQPAAGDWYGIQLYGNADNDGIGEFDYCLFRYGGYAGATYDANVYFNVSDSGYMRHCISEHSGQHGVRIVNCSPEIINSTFSHNTLFGLHVSSGVPMVINSIIWGNTSGGISGAPVVAYSDIQGGFDGEGNIEEDPQFLDAAKGDYHLDICSPAVDAGDPVEILTADYSPGQLIVNVNAVTAVNIDDIVWITDGAEFESDEVFGTTATMVAIKQGYANAYTVADRSYLYTATSNYLDEPAPSGLRIDMGAYGGSGEATPSVVCRGDLMGNDQDVDGDDLIGFLLAYGSSAGDTNFNPIADINRDGTVDHNDLFMFAGEFGRIDCPVCP
jgi:parallel beta-helix repeat protein